MRKFIKRILKKNNEKWFYIQVGNYLRTVFILNTQKLDKKTRLQFHVEFSKDEITINKMFYELLINVKPDIANMLEEIPQEFVSKETTGSCYLWFDIKNTENISTKEELFEIFSEYLKIFDSAIDLIFFTISNSLKK